ncbi:MAG: methyltransferase domain-containing protein [Cyclobacteriaceae bacterium]
MPYFKYSAMLEERSEEVEIMDDLEISGEVVFQTLRELNTINKYLGGNRISVSAFQKIAQNKEAIVLADLGCGGGDIMMEMAKWCKKKGINGSFLGVDANPHIVQFARKNTSEFPEIRFKAVNIFGDELKKEKPDLIHCCLFTHHFSGDELVQLFRQFKDQARIGVIINDLQRHPIAYWSIKILTRLFSKSTMVRNDAAVSVARGFKKNELVQILHQARITEYKLSWHWAFRWKLIF